MNPKVRDEIEKVIAELHAECGDKLATRNDYILLLIEAVKNLDVAIHGKSGPFVWIETYHALLHLSAASAMLLETFVDTSIPVS